MGGFNDLARDLSVPFAQGGAQGNNQALALNTFKQQKMIEQQMALDLMKQRAQAQQDLQMNVLKQQAEIRRKDREAEFGMYSDSLKNQAEADKIKSEMPGPGPQPYQQVQTPSPSPLNPEGKGVQMWPGMETLYNTLFNSGEESPQQGSTPTPPPYLQVPTFSGGKAGFVPKPNPAVKSITERTPTGWESRDAYVLETKAKELFPNDVVAQRQWIREQMGGMIEGTAYSRGQGATRGANSPTSQDARAGTKEAVTEAGIKTQTRPDLVQRQAASKETINTAGGRGSAVGAAQGNLAQAPGAPPGVSNAEAVATAKEMGQGLPTDTQTVLAGFDNISGVINQLRSEFPITDRAKYVGFINRPLSQVMQTVNNDPKVARFLNLTNQLRMMAFDLGGKQLTPMEKQVVESILPIGNEYSLADFEANLQGTEERLTRLRNARVQSGTATKGQVRRAAPAPTPTPKTPQATHRFNPATGRIEPLR